MTFAKDDSLRFLLSTLVTNCVGVPTSGYREIILFSLPVNVFACLKKTLYARLSDGLPALFVGSRDRASVA